jgi:carboxyl-terminal processing protease
MQRFILIFFLLVSSLFASKLPEIESEDASKILLQIMEAHATHKNLSPVLIERALSHYVEGLDPVKTYFLKDEVEKWTKAPKNTLEGILKNIEKGDFTCFNEIQETMVKAIGRRARLEKNISSKELPSDVSVKEFKDLSWAGSEEELETRLLRIRALQTQAAEKLEAKAKEKVLQRIEKKRHVNEEEISTKDPVQKKRTVLAGALKAIAASFDAHTAYFTPLEASQFMISVQQRLFGIGAQLRDDLSGFTIVKIIEGSPAERSDLEENDRVIAIDGEPVVGMEITDAVELIRGVEGTKVKLTVLREEKPGQEEKLDIVVVRGEVVIKEARIESKTTPYGDGVIAHISLHAFYQDPNRSSAGDLYEEISKIRKDHKIRGIVLDLRDNSGGILPQAVAVTGLFITKGIVVGVKDNTGKVEFLREIDGRTVYDGPLVVLTSKGSASAAEIVAQTLQDYGRAIIVGDEHTYGKGTFQTFTLDSSGNGKVNPKGEFKVTRGRYYTVSGKSPQLVGVQADIVVPGPFSALEIGEKHAEYPLDNDSIPENYRDDLSDIPTLQREQVSWLYRFNLQPRLKTYTRFIGSLKKNSEERLKEDKLYQHFLTELKKGEDAEVEPEIVEIYRDADLQLKEATNVMKDLVLLLNS